MPNDFNIAAALLTLKTDKPHEFEKLFLDALYAGNAPAVEKLLNAGAALGVLDNDGNTALHWAAGYGHANIVKLLIDRGAGLNVHNNEGNTALQLAAGYGHANIVKLLKESANSEVVITRPTATISIFSIRNALGLK